jgi:hypothetical protein
MYGTGTQALSAVDTSILLTILADDPCMLLRRKPRISSEQGMKE